MADERKRPSDVVTVTFHGHLDGTQAQRVLREATKQMDRGRQMIVDCREMTGYEPDARQRFIEWQREHRAKLDAVAVVTEKVLWHVVVGTMNWLAGVNMRAFPSLEEAEAWIGATDASPPMVRGVALVGPIKYLRLMAPEAEDRFHATLRAESAEALQSRVRKLSTYTYPVFVDLLRTLDGIVGSGDLASLFQLGQFCADEDLTSTHKLLATLDDPERLVRSCARVWAAYYEEAGHLEAVRWKPHNTVLALRNFPEMDESHRALMDGWMFRALQRVGADVLDHGYERTEDGATHFRFRWRRIDAAPRV